MASKFLDWLKKRGEPSPVETFAHAANEDEIREAGKAPLSEIAKRVKRIEISTRKKADVVMTGQYRSRFRGQGMQFSDVRVYQYGDDVRHIDWRSTARSQQAYVKTFEEERELNILLAVDVSASTAFGSEIANKRDTLALTLASIAFSATANRDLVGLLLYSDQVERYVPPRKGRKHVLRLLDEMLNYEPTHRKTDLNVALKAIPGLLRHTSVIFMASDFNAAINKNQMKRIAARHDLIALHVTDPREMQLPSIGMVQVQDPETGQSLVIDTGSAMLRKKFQQSQEKWHREMDDFLRSTGASVIRLSTDRDPTNDLMGFFATRRRLQR